MTAGELAALIVAAAGLLTALGTFLVAVGTFARMTHVARSVNGHSEALNALTASASFAEGKLAGQIEAGSALVPTQDLDHDQD